MDSPEPCLCTVLRQAARHVSQHYDAQLSPVGLSVTQFAILARLDRLGPSPITALAGDLAMDRSTLGHLLRPLEARGLVTLGVAADRRARAVRLTAAGETLLAQGRPLWRLAQERFKQRFGADEADALRVSAQAVTATDLRAGPAALPSLSPTP